MPHTSKPSAAAKIPVEALDRIISFYKIDSPQRVHLSKGELGAISLVCRTWTPACQPQLFENIALYSLKDANKLLELMSHPSSRIGGTPWIHIACRKLKHHPKLPSSLQFHLKHSPLESGFFLLDSDPIDGKQVTTAIRSPMSRCHRIMCMDTLYLWGVKFARLEDLGRVVGELPCLRVAFFQMAEWNEPKEGSEFPPLPSCRKSSQKSLTCVYNMTTCTDNRAGLWLACLHPPNKTPQVRIEDLRALYETVMSIFARGFISVARENDAIYVNRRLGVYSLMVTLRSPDTSPQHVHSFRFIDPRPSCPELWTRLDKYISSQGDLHEVCFHFTDSKNIQQFATDIVAACMPFLSFSSKLKFTLETTEGVEKHTVCQTNAIRQEIEHWLEEKAKECEWTSEDVTALSCAFRERDLKAYKPMILKLRKAPWGCDDPESEDEENPASEDKETTEREHYKDGDETEDSGEQKERNLETHKRLHECTDQDVTLSHRQRPQKRPRCSASVCIPELYHEEEDISHGQHWPSLSQSRPTDAHASPCGCSPCSSLSQIRNAATRQQRSIIIRWSGTELAAIWGAFRIQLMVRNAGDEHFGEV
ncbi:hypothetical protein NM688_g2952 [Phlebia brevispora]|uniref:Uncharacterized protein n=1 Tax=Phlebia brevispora TaxID=194682 RepID=A0ACC1T717_9APHY|nr:hypothetical protein NM688_g2952 [Phlebia brevispora]